MNAWQLLKNSTLEPKEAEMLLSFLVGQERLYVLTHPEIGLSAETARKFQALEKKRLDGWSMAALTREKEFYGLKFAVDKNVLIPRPETELMVDTVLTLINEITGPGAIIDLGTGSGAIITTLAHVIQSSAPAKYSELIFSAHDISAAALKIARRNARLNEQATKIKFSQGNLLKPLLGSNNWPQISKNPLIICANLPYLSPKQVALSPSIQKEPRLALIGGPDGLKYYRALFKQLASANNKTTPLRAVILCEIDPSQSRTIKTLMKQHLPQAKIQIYQDLSGKDRLAQIKI